MFLTVTLNAAIDKTLRVANLQIGRRHRCAPGDLQAGGKGINVARALRALGQPVVATGLAGGRAGLVRAVAAKGLAVTLDPGERVRERIVLPRRLDRRVQAGERLGYVELSSTRGVIGRVPLVADRAGGGHPALVPWLRSQIPHVP